MINSMQTDRYNHILDVVFRCIAHPHSTVVAHDKHRAIALISFLSNDNDLVEYLYSQMSEEDSIAVKHIRKSIGSLR